MKTLERKLEIPPEPKKIQESILALRSRLSPSSGIDWDSLAVWAGNRIPQYLWAKWKMKLREEGFTWQRFLQLMKYRTADAILWANGRISWEDFVNKVLASIRGPLGKALIESG
jgi:hypothetical protein